MDQGYGGIIACFTGTMVAPLNPDPETIMIEDIAHALAMQCRFTGHTRWHYSVAQHSVGVSQLVPDTDRLRGLLHDATEAYLSDIARPIKRFAGEFGAVYTAVEDGLMEAVSARFGLGDIMTKAVKDADNIMLANEIRTLMPESPSFDGWETYPDVPPGMLMALTPEQAEANFMHRYYELGGAYA